MADANINQSDNNEERSQAANQATCMAVDDQDQNETQVNRLKRRLSDCDDGNWQLHRGTVSERIKHLLFNKIMSDITFIVGEEQVPAHKFILSIASNVFEAMFYGSLATKLDHIDIPDVEPNAFRNLLCFIYTDEVQITGDNVMATLYAAKKYAVVNLEKQCVLFLEKGLNQDNAFLLLTQARLFDIPQLSVQCYDIIDRQTQNCLNADCFLDIDYATLEYVLTRDTLRVREIVLYDAVMRWAEAECKRKNLPVNIDNQRTVLNKCVNLIRYPLMTSQEFASGPAQSGLLTDKQMVQLFLYFNLNPKPNSEFLATPRCCMTVNECVCSRFRDVDSRWGYSGASDRIEFQVDKRIFVAGYGVYGSIHGPVDYDVEIQLVHVDSENKLASNKSKISCDGSNSPYKVLFKEPVEVLPNTSYCAVATIKGRDSFYGTKGSRTVTVYCSYISRDITFQFSYASGTNNGTNVEDGQIPEIIFFC